MRTSGASSSAATGSARRASRRCAWPRFATPRCTGAPTASSSTASAPTDRDRRIPASSVARVQSTPRSLRPWPAWSRSVGPLDDDRRIPASSVARVQSTPRSLRPWPAASLACLVTLPRGRVILERHGIHEERGMSKTKAERAGDIYEIARENPYVQRLIEDEDLRESLKDAFEASKRAYGRATGNGKGTVKAVTGDKKVQKDLRKAAENLQEVSDRLRQPKKR